LDFVQNFETAAERSVGFGPGVQGLVDLPQNAMGRAFFETEATLLRRVERSVGSNQCLPGVSGGEVGLGERNLRKCDRVCVLADRARRHPL
jgi:hypothetical protein